MERLDPEDLGARFAAKVMSEPELLLLSAAEIKLARTILSGDSVPETTIALASELGDLLHERAWPSPYVNWALIRPIAMVMEGLLWRLDRVEAAEIGRRMGKRFDDWSAQMPLTPVWNTLSKYTLNEELEFLERTLLRTTYSRRRFGQRLAEILSSDRAALVAERWRNYGVKKRA
jgi:hypothetical protein